MDTNTIKIAINGFGRIGRAFFKQAVVDEGVEVVAINDVADGENLAYLLRYDSAYGRYDREVSYEEGDGERQLQVADESYPLLQESNPKKLPWDDLGVDVVVESTGVFDKKEKAAWHLEAGAKRVVISANAEGDIPHAIVGASEFDEVTIGENITSDGSCTTNAIVPAASLIEQHIGIEKGFMMTVHGYTASQDLVDSPNSKTERGRAAAQNIALTTTSAAEAAPKALPFLSRGENFEAHAVRVPVLTGSLMEFVFISKQDTTADEVNGIFTEAVTDKRWQQTLAVTDEKLVSSDIVGEKYGAIVSLPDTQVLGGNLVKIAAWYDNEWGYAHTLLAHIKSLTPLL